MSSRVLVALGPDGRPRIAYSDGAPRLATRRETGWVRSTVAASGAPVSLQVGPDGRAQLFYLSEGLRYAVLASPGWVSESVDPTASTGSLALTPGGCPLGMWMGPGSPYYGSRTANGWVTRAASPDESHSLGDEPLALDSSGRAFTAAAYLDSIYVNYLVTP